MVFTHSEASTSELETNILGLLVSLDVDNSRPFVPVEKFDQCRLLILGLGKRLSLAQMSVLLPLLLRCGRAVGAQRCTHHQM